MEQYGEEPNYLTLGTAYDEKNSIAIGQLVTLYHCTFFFIFWLYFPLFHFTPHTQCEFCTCWQQKIMKRKAKSKTEH